MFKKRIFVFGIILLVLLYFSILNQKFTLSSKINIYIPNLEDFKEEGIYKNKEGSTVHIEAENDKVLLKMRISKKIDKESAEEYMNYQLNMLNSTFEPIKSPYPGRITRERVCSEEFKLVKVNKDNSSSTYYLLYSTNRYSYGTCSWDSIRYRVIFLFRYCENKKELYQVEMFIPVDEFNESYEKMAEKVRCKN